MAADDALTQHSNNVLRLIVHAVAMLTRETSELISTDCGHLRGWHSNICYNCAVVLLHLLARIESEIKNFTARCT